MTVATLHPHGKPCLAETASNWIGLDWTGLEIRQWGRCGMKPPLATSLQCSAPLMRWLHEGRSCAGSCCWSQLAEGWREHTARSLLPCLLPASTAPAAARLLAPCPAAAFAPSTSASSQSSSFVQFSFVLRCPGKRLLEQAFALMQGQGALPSGQGFPLASVLLLCLPWKHPSASVLFHPQGLLPHDVLGGLWGSSSPGWDCSLRDAPGVKQILQRPSMALGHLPEGAGARLRDAGFAV